MNIREGIRNIIGARAIYRNLPFVYFLGALGLCYIAGVHYAERNMRKAERLKSELQETRWKYMSAHAEVVRMGTRGRITRVVEGKGLAPAVLSPAQLMIHGKSRGHE